MICNPTKCSCKDCCIVFTNLEIFFDVELSDPDSSFWFAGKMAVGVHPLFVVWLDRESFILETALNMMEYITIVTIKGAM